MGFLLLCLALWALLAFKVPVDTYGWLFLLATAWLLGFLDGRHRPGQDDAAPLPEQQHRQHPGEVP
jgi:hypothetical protein